MQQHSHDGVLRGVLRQAVRGSSAIREAPVQEMAERGWWAECDRCRCTGDTFAITHASPYVVIKIMRNHYELEHELECAFCFLKFAGFKELAIHVNDAHVSRDAMAERLAREAWHPDDDKESEMLPAPGKRGGDSGGGGSARGRRGAPTVPFLTAEDVRKEATNAKILAVVTENTGYNDIIVKISLDGKRFFWGLKTSNPAYEILFEGLGADETKWIGQEISVGLEFSELYEKNFVACFDAPAKGSKKK